MKKPTPLPRRRIRPHERSWNNGAYVEVLLYARSLQQAAWLLIEKLELNPSTTSTWDVGPIVILYKQAVELHLKNLVGEGCYFLKSPTDSITLSTTHSLRWLAQLVSQIIRAVKWESAFTCEGVSSLSEFRPLIDELEALDPVWLATRPYLTNEVGSPPKQFETGRVLPFAKKLDALIVLLETTADALAAEWDMRSEISGSGNSGFKPTIQ
jgi:hypothetical protein